MPAHWQVLPDRACYAKKAFEKDMVGVMKDDTQLFKLYSDSESFRRSLTDGVFALLDDRAR